MIWLTVTAVLFLLADFLYRKAGRRAWAHPVLLPVVVLVAAYGAGLFDMQAYQAGVAPLGTLLAVAVVGLAVPLSRSLSLMRANRAALVASVAGGSVAGVLAALVPAYLLGAPDSLLASLATKSITTPLAVTVAGTIGGIPGVAAAVVIVTGLVAALVGPVVLRLAGVDDPLATGLALGTAGHAIGTAEAARLSDTMGGAAALAMTMNGLATALVLPLLWPLLA